MKTPENLGTCKLCGKYRVLTEEHVPPKKAFNSNRLIEYKFEDVLDTLTGNSGRLPWDYSGLNGRIIQGGNRDFYLCKECNNNTGSWYMDEYVRLTHTLHHMLYTNHAEPGQKCSFNLMDFYPLRVFKAVMTMFCDINFNFHEDEQLKNYLLNKECTEFDNKKYSVYAFLVSPKRQRINGISGMLIKGISEPIIVSEMAHYPIGFALYIDKPEDYVPQGVNINSFSSFDYNAKGTIEFHGMPYYQINSQYPTDFRSQREIQDCAEGNRKSSESNA